MQQAQTARVLAKEVDFGEFSQIYPDKDACLSYLADLKWASGYQCRKCGYEKYCDGPRATCPALYPLPLRRVGHGLHYAAKV